MKRGRENGNETVVRMVKTQRGWVGGWVDGGLKSKSVIQKEMGKRWGRCGGQRQAQKGGSSSAQLCVLAGCEKQLSSFQHRKATGRHCTRPRERDGDGESDGQRFE